MQPANSGGNHDWSQMIEDSPQSAKDFRSVSFPKLT
jgi:hypothetical protein